MVLSDPVWTIEGTINLGIINESELFEYELPLTSPAECTSYIISGSLPNGLQLVDNKISGMPYEVASLQPFSFVIRADNGIITYDKTFNIKIDGPDVPIWLTNEGSLPIGPNDIYYVLDESYVNFQLEAIDTDTIAGQKLSFWIDSKGGILPPGLTLTSDGRIYGFIKPLLVQQAKKKTGFYDSYSYDSDGYDKNTINSYGFDTYGYELTGYDNAESFEQPTKLNRNYEFIVSISDGNTVSKRKFKIYVVGDDSFFVDNEIIHSAYDIFTADITSLRDPIWKTDSYLGTYRANNYQTFKIDIYDIVAKNPVLYSLDKFNPDGTLSQIPEGLQFDTTTCELFGIIPYQPAVTKEYNFTITATRIGRVRVDSISVSLDSYPLNINNDILYRNYGLEEASWNAHRVYTSINYIDSRQGIKLHQPESGDPWIYENYGLNVKYYSMIDAYYPWDATGWFLDQGLTVPAPTLTISIVADETLSYKSHYDTASSSTTFTVKVIGEIDKSISWNTSSNLGILETELPCSLLINAVASDNSVLNYSIVSGELPPGLTLGSTGEISGSINQFKTPRITKFDFTLDNNTTTIDRVYTFDILASDIAKSQQIIRTFFITVYTPNMIQLSSIHVTPMLNPIQREKFRTFITSSDVFEFDAIYRPGDPNFGIQNSLQMLIFGGIETQTAEHFMATVGQNHARKKFKFGDIKIAKAIVPGTHTEVYEVIYVEVIDPIEHDGTHLLDTVYTSRDNNPITIDNNPFIVTIDRTDIMALDPYTVYKHPSSISLWRQRIYEIGQDDRHYLPLWMRSIQDGSMVELDYVPAITLCYCKPGHAESILLNIKHYLQTVNFSFSEISYDVDRYIVSSTKGTEFSINEIPPFQMYKLYNYDINNPLYVLHRNKLYKVSGLPYYNVPRLDDNGDPILDNYNNVILDPVYITEETNIIKLPLTIETQLYPNNAGFFTNIAEYKENFFITHAYYENDIVLYKDEIYRCIQNCYAIAPTNEEYFEKLLFAKEFNLYVTYNPGDTVSIVDGSVTSSYTATKIVSGILPFDTRFFTQDGYQEDKYIFFNNDRTTIS